MRYKVPVVFLLSLFLLPLFLPSSYASTVKPENETEKAGGSAAKQASGTETAPVANETQKTDGSAAKQAPDIEMVKVKGGCFQMGDSFGLGRSDEKPVHKVCLNDFSIGKYEVTQAQWQAVMGNNPAFFQECGPDCPVESVSWDEAQAFIKSLNGMKGKNYRLPTEAEWEYAARSGGKQEVWTGTNKVAEIGDYAWFEDNSEEKTQPAGKKKPNGLGIYDMNGNVWEMCQDLYTDGYYKSSPKNNPQGPTRATSHAIRGGSWSSAPWHLRIADRGRMLPNRSNNGMGFRLVLPAAGAPVANK